LRLDRRHEQVDVGGLKSAGARRRDWTSERHVTWRRDRQHQQQHALPSRHSYRHHSCPSSNLPAVSSNRHKMVEEDENIMLPPCRLCCAKPARHKRKLLDPKGSSNDASTAGLQIQLWPGMTLTFDLLTPKVDLFMPLPLGSLVPICSKIDYHSFSQFW